MHASGGGRVRGGQGRAVWRGRVGWAGSAGARGQCGARRCGCPSDNPWLSSTLRSDPIALSCVSSSGQWREWGGAGARARMGLGRRWDVAIISRARCWGELTGGGYLALFCGRGGSHSRALRAARPGVHGRHAGWPEQGVVSHMRPCPQLSQAAPASDISVRLGLGWGRCASIGTGAPST